MTGDRKRASLGRSNMIGPEPSERRLNRQTPTLRILDKIQPPGFARQLLPHATSTTLPTNALYRLYFIFTTCILPVDRYQLFEYLRIRTHSGMSLTRKLGSASKMCKGSLAENGRPAFFVRKTRTDIMLAELTQRLCVPVDSKHCLLSPCFPTSSSDAQG